ncbi:MAG: molybdopterin-dependent oxidoreductase [Chloroflexi bacterium]|nr:molybdopterin-dependent oxidoreductase [Chloroflexota bacterium]
MVIIYIDHQPFEVNPNQNLLAAALSVGLDLPYFCWHPALGSVGACRQCAVKQFRDEKDTRGRLVMACMTPAKDGTRISIDDPEARAFRESVIEWLMENHPHDCPICDEGGECHLQDMTVMTGHAYRRYRAAKRTFRNQYLGPFVNHEMNRCIQCYRCVRLYRDYANGRDFDAFSIHNTVFFGRHADGVLENEFSGNLIEVCPTGVFTDATLKRHYTRKWDMQSAPSVCVHCAVGCNTFPDERYGVLRRIRARYNGAVNGYFLCDRGRYGYEFVNGDRRTRQVMFMDGAARGTTRIKRVQSASSAEASQAMMTMPGDAFSLDAAGFASPGFARRAPSPNAPTRDQALQRVSDLLARGKRVIGIGSPRASLESNFALRTLVGADNFYQGIAEREARLVSLMSDILQNGPSRSPSLKEVETCDAVLVLGEDVTNYAPMLALALRQAVRKKAIREIAVKLGIPEWDDKAVREAIQGQKGPLFLATPNATKLEDIATAVYHAAPDDIARLGYAVARGLGADVPEVAGFQVDAIVAALKNAQRPLVVAGPSLGSEAIIQAAANVAWAANARLVFTMPEANSFGLGLIGGPSLDAAFQAQADVVIILENDLYRRADADVVDTFLAGAKHVVVLDHVVTPTTAKAEILLPAATFAEADGTFVNDEGRAQRAFQVFVPEGDIAESWRWLRDIAAAAGRAEMIGWRNLDDVAAALGEQLAIFKPIVDLAPPAGFRIAGMKVARQPARATGRTAMTAHLSVHEPKPPDDPDTPLSFSMEGFQGTPPSPLVPRFWAPGWNSIQALNKFQSEVGGPLQGGDPGKQLVEPTEGAPTFFREIPAAFAPREGEWLIVPLYHIFGSEELSVLSPGIAELTPEPYLALNADDAARLQANEIEIALSNHLYRLPVKIVSALPAGVAGVPNGLPGLPWIALPAFGKITKAA